MEIYESLLEAVSREYDTIALLKESERGRVSLVRHRGSGTRYIFRHFSGSGEVYQKLLGVSCRNLPQIMEVGEKNGQTVALEEYIPGDTLGEILEGELLSAAQAKQVTRQLCGALWVLHSRGMVHRDVKPDNVILPESIKVQVREIRRFLERPDLPHRSSTDCPSRTGVPIFMRSGCCSISC